MKIDFTPEQIAVIDQAVQQLPYFVAAPLIHHINKQIAEYRDQVSASEGNEKQQ